MEEPYSENNIGAIMSLVGCVVLGIIILIVYLIVSSRKKAAIEQARIDELEKERLRRIALANAPPISGLIRSETALVNLTHDSNAHIRPKDIEITKFREYDTSFGSYSGNDISCGNLLNSNDKHKTTEDLMNFCSSNPNCKGFNLTSHDAEDGKYCFKSTLHKYLPFDLENNQTSDLLFTYTK